MCARLAAPLLVLTACQGRGQSTIYVVAGPAAGQHVEFRPVSSYAELVSYPGERRELRVTLASYVTSCDSFVTPSVNDTSVTITVVAPAEAELGPGSYQWAGLDAHGGTNPRPERPYALPTLRLGHASLALQPGGELQLQGLSTSQDARVRGLLNFEFAGDAEHAATSLKGSFEAKLCRVRL